MKYTDSFFEKRVFGAWTTLRVQVKEYSYKKTNKKVVCRCVCGNIKSVVASKLVTGKSTNCGCIQYKNLSKFMIEKANIQNRIHKKCTKCEETKEVSAFTSFIHENGRRYHRSDCKSCRRLK